jgi:multiple sugar transport system permease protein
MQTTNVIKPSKLRSFLSTRSPKSSAIYQRQMRAAYFFLLPGLFIFLTLNIYPLLKALQISFYDWSIMPNQPSQFVGLENYLRAFKDPIVWLSFKNTLLYTVVTVPGQVALAMGAALLLNDLGRGKVFFRVIYYLPVITSWVIVSLLFRYMFQSPNGFIN